MDNVLIVVDDVEAAKAFFAELGMELEGELAKRPTAAKRSTLVRTIVHRAV
jgi:catechol 2,3-dioxygenase-like lactoylglutathione lyase family enzyme